MKQKFEKHVPEKEIKEVKDKLKDVKKHAKEEKQALVEKNNEILNLLVATLAQKEKDKSQMIISTISLAFNVTCWIICFALLFKGIG